MVKLLPNIINPQTINITPSGVEVDSVSFYYQRVLVDTVSASSTVVGNLLEVTISIELKENRSYTFEAKNADDEVLYKGVAETWADKMIQNNYIIPS